MEREDKTLLKVHVPSAEQVAILGQFAIRLHLLVGEYINDVSPAALHSVLVMQATLFLIAIDKEMTENDAR